MNNWNVNEYEQNIIKIEKNIHEMNVLNVKFKHEWLSKEFLFIVNMILMIE